MRSWKKVRRQVGQVAAQRWPVPGPGWPSIGSISASSSFSSSLPTRSMHRVRTARPLEDVVLMSIGIDGDASRLTFDDLLLGNPHLIINEPMLF